MIQTSQRMRDNLLRSVLKQQLLVSWSCNFVVGHINIFFDYSPKDWFKWVVFFNRYCVLECIDSSLCPEGAKYADVIEFRTLALPSGILPQQDLIRLTVFNQNNVKMVKTDFVILENDTQVTFNLRPSEGTGILYTEQPLEELETYRIKVRARSYSAETGVLQYQTTFMIHISISAYPYWWVVGGC